MLYFITFDSQGMSCGCGQYSNDEDAPDPLPQGDVECTAEDFGNWRECALQDGKVVPASTLQIQARAAATASAAQQSAAYAALAESDKTVLRCYEGAVPVPEAWVNYRKALRAIVSAASGDASQALPEKPPYPAGT